MTTNPRDREALLPCPFCGAHIVETGRGYAVHHRLGCFAGAKGSTYFLPHELAAWNTRTADTERARMRAVLVEARELHTAYRKLLVKQLSEHGFPSGMICRACNSYWEDNREGEHQDGCLASPKALATINAELGE